MRIFCSAKRARGTKIANICGWGEPLDYSVTGKLGIKLCNVC